MTTATQTETTDAPDEEQLVETYIRRELAGDGYDLPELAETMEEADARATASTYLFAMRNLEREVDANAAEFTALLEFSKTRHVKRQTTLVTQVEYLRSVVRKLFGFMTVTGKKKSLNLLGGRVGLRGKQDELVVEDDEAVVRWAKEKGFPELLRIKHTIDRKALKNHVMLNQETKVEPRGDVLPPGVRLEARPDEFFATPATD